MRRCLLTAVRQSRPDAASCSSAAVRSRRPSCRQLLRGRARDVRVVAPHDRAGRSRSAGAGGRRSSAAAFVPADLDGAWLVVAAATPEVNRAGGGGRRGAAHLRQRRRRSRQRVGVSQRRRPARRRDAGDFDQRRRAGADRRCCARRSTRCCRAISARGCAARATQRAEWRRDGVPMEQRRPLLLEALNELYRTPATGARRRQETRSGCDRRRRRRVDRDGLDERDRARVARRRRTRRSGAADAQGGRAPACARISCSTTRWSTSASSRFARHAQRFFVGKRAGRHAMSQDGDPRA